MLWKFRTTHNGQTSLSLVSIQVYRRITDVDTLSCSDFFLCLHSVDKEEFQVLVIEIYIILLSDYSSNNFFCFQKYCILLNFSTWVRNGSIDLSPYEKTSLRVYVEKSMDMNTSSSNHVLYKDTNTFGRVRVSRHFVCLFPNKTVYPKTPVVLLIFFSILDLT